jgi:cleavage and polyadenylation specificity factor subunit 1
VGNMPDAFYERELAWSRVGEGRTYTNLVYDPPSQAFVAASVFDPPFGLFDDEGNPTWTPECNVSFPFFRPGLGRR